MKYKTDLLNNNIPLYAVISDNKHIILRTIHKDFAKKVTFFLNNQKEILEILNFSSKEFKTSSCKKCIPVEKCHDCRFVTIIPILEKMLKEVEKITSIKDEK